MSYKEENKVKEKIVSEAKADLSMHIVITLNPAAEWKWLGRNVGVKLSPSSILRGLIYKGLNGYVFVCLPILGPFTFTLRNILCIHITLQTKAKTYFYVIFRSHKPILISIIFRQRGSERRANSWANCSVGNRHGSFFYTFLELYTEMRLPH